MFSPIRRSSLCLALVRFVMWRLQFAVSKCPEPHHRNKFQCGRCFTGVQSQSRSVAYGGGKGWSQPIYTRQRRPTRSEEHTSELQSLMRISYAVFCLKKKKQ